MELAERITGRVIEPAGARPAQRGFGLLVPPRGQASGTGDLPGDYRPLAAAAPDAHLRR